MMRGAFRPASCAGCEPRWKTHAEARRDESMADTEEFHEEQKHYLQGFLSGSDLARGLNGLPTFASTLGIAGNAPVGTNSVGNGKAEGSAESVPAGPEAIHFLAQNRTLAEGKKLTPQEEAKRRRHP